MKSFTMEKTIPLNLVGLDDVIHQINVARYELTFSLVTDAPTDSSEDLLKASLEQNVSFAKVVTFIEGVIEHSIMIAFDNKDFKQIFDMGWENNIMVMPDVNESTLIATLHSKLNHIVADNTFVETLSLKDLTHNITYQYFKNDEENYSELPTKEEWITELSHWQTPWWQRDDAVTTDYDAETKEMLEEWKAKAEESDLETKNREIFTDIEDAVHEAVAKITKPDSERGQLVEVDFTKKKKDRWKPTLV